MAASDQLPQDKISSLESGSWEAGSRLGLGATGQNERPVGGERMYLKSRQSQENSKTNWTKN